MKNFNKSLLTLLALASFAAPIRTFAQNSPQDTAVIFDLDDVIIKKTKGYKAQIALYGFQLNPIATWSYIQGLMGIKSRYGKDSTMFHKGEKINGLTFDFLYHGMQDPLILPYAAGLVKKIEQSRDFIPSTEKIIHYLKSKGYPIIIATNKDRISYNYAAEYHGAALTNLADKVIVAHPGNSQQLLTDIGEFAALPATPQDYKQLYHDAVTAQPTKVILHAPTRKPETPYYQFVFDAAKDYKNLVFIDDNKENITNFNALQGTTEHNLIGIRFDKKNPLHLADELIQRGILSEKDDAAFLQDLRYSQLSALGKLKFNTQKLMSTLRPA